MLYRYKWGLIGLAGCLVLGNILILRYNRKYGKIMALMPHKVKF